MVIAVDSDGPGYLVLSDLFYPGWKAYSQGRELPILPANYLFRAVEIPAGRSEVSFAYHPRSFVYGVALSLCSVCVVAMAAIGVAWRRRRGA